MRQKKVTTHRYNLIVPNLHNDGLMVLPKPPGQINIYNVVISTFLLVSDCRDKI